MIRLECVSKTFGDLVALQSTTLLIESGKTTVLIGPSGCGKSTVLRLIAGLIEPATGHVEVASQLVSSSTILSLRRRMGYVIQDGGLFPHMTADQNITLMARHLKSPVREIEERLKMLCELTHFPKDGLDRFPVELSGGQRQRVSLMRALMLDPDVLLLDEPLAALDPMVRSTLQHDLKYIFQRLGKTVILVTHDMAEAGYLGDAIILMQEGRVVQSGTLDDMRERPADLFVTRFINAQRGPVSI